MKEIDELGNTTQYTYDNVDNLISVIDAYGNVNTKNTYDENGMLSAVTDVFGVTDRTIYDVDGQVKKTIVQENTSVEQVTEYVYTKSGLLKEAKDSEGQISKYEYDAEGNRVAQIDQITGACTEYVIDESSNVLTATEIDNGNRFVTTYVYGDGLISQKNSKNGYLTFHYNNIGSTMMLTDENGNVNEEYSYGPYGELLSGDASKTTYLYNGEYGVATDANGLYYMRARYYNVAIKRFINQDVITGTIDNSSSLNKYAYVQGNPISLNDPFGLWPKLPKLKLPKKWSKAAHTALDIGGLFFDGCDAANAALYRLVDW